MSKIKINLKLIIVSIISFIFGVCFTVSANSLIGANDVIYTKNNETVSIEEALNELYNGMKKTSDDWKIITTSGDKTLDKYYKNIRVNVTANDWEYMEQPADGKPAVFNVGYKPEIAYGFYNNAPMILIGETNKVYHIKGNISNWEDWSNFFSFNSNGFIVETYAPTKENFRIWIKKPN